MKFTPILLFISISIGGYAQVSKLETAVFKEENVSERKFYTYEYAADGRIKKQTCRMHMPDVPIIHNTQIPRAYTYTKTGKLKQIENLYDFSKEERFYDSQDSLLSELHTDDYGVKVFIRKLTYHQGRLKTESITRLTKIYSPQERYDTLFQNLEYFYSGNQVIKIISRNNKGSITEETLHSYDNNQRIKTEIYSINGSERTLTNTTTFTFTGGKLPDFLTSGPTGNKFAYRTTNPDKTQRSVVYEGNIITTRYFNTAGKPTVVIKFDFEED